MAEAIDEGDSQYGKSMRELVARMYGDGADLSVEMVNGLPQARLLKGYPGRLLLVADRHTIPVMHEPHYPAFASFDWEWLKMQIKELRQQAQGTAAVAISLVDGTIGTRLLADQDLLVSPITDEENEVLVAIDYGGDIRVIERTSWADLQLGKPWELLKPLESSGTQHGGKDRPKAPHGDNPPRQ